MTETPSRRAHFLLTPVGSSGDVHPFVGVGRALRARGHDVTVMTAEPFRALVERGGLRFVATQSQQDFDEITKHPDLWHSRRGPQVIFQAVASIMRDNYRQLTECVEPGRTVLVGHALSLATRMFEDVHHTPAATLQLAPSIFRSDYQQPIYRLGWDGSRLPVSVKRALWWLTDRWLIDPMLAPPLNAWRRELGLPPISRVFKEWLNSPHRVIGLFPEWFAQPQPDWPPQLQLTSFPLFDEAEDRQLGEGLTAFLDAGPPPILVTPGSANRAASKFFAATLEAIRRLGRRGLVLTPYREQLPSALGTDVWHEPYVPLSLVLRRCAALVHHGGIGTCAQGLAAGIPQLTMPLSFDQPDNATRLVRLGVGRAVGPEQYTATRVAEALSALDADWHVSDNWERWSRALSRASGIEQTCAILEALIQPAVAAPACATLDG